MVVRLRLNMLSRRVIRPAVDAISDAMLLVMRIVADKNTHDASTPMKMHLYWSTTDSYTMNYCRGGISSDPSTIQLAPPFCHVEICLD